jgi:hypothetical protein
LALPWLLSMAAHLSACILWNIVIPVLTKSSFTLMTAECCFPDSHFLWDWTSFALALQHIPVALLRFEAAPCDPSLFHHGNSGSIWEMAKQDSMKGSCSTPAPKSLTTKPQKHARPSSPSYVPLPPDLLRRAPLSCEKRRHVSQLFCHKYNKHQHTPSVLVAPVLHSRRDRRAARGVST